jgi:phage terminase small subunit
MNFVPLREPAVFAVMRGALRAFLSKMASGLGLTFTAACDLAQSVLADDDQSFDYHEGNNSGRRW